MIDEKIQQILQKGVIDAGYDIDVSLSFSNKPDLCDYQFNGVFALAKKLGQNPKDIAENIISKTQKSDLFDIDFAFPGFINIKLTQKALEEVAKECLESPKGGLKEHEHKKRILMDYGGANVAKALHVGHLRSPIIGQALKNLYRIFGDEVISDVHLGDWGLQMGLTELGLKEEGILDYYFSGKGKEPNITLDMLNEAYPKASKRKDEDPEFLKQAEDITLSIQQKKEPYYSIYKKIRSVSVKEIKKHYTELGADFDLWLGESDAADYIDRTIGIFVDKGLARTSEGALIVDVAQEGEQIPIEKKSPDEPQRYKNPMPPAILKKSNGADLYATTDIATVLMRNEKFGKLDEIQYIADNRQALHFTQFIRCCKKAGISPDGQELIYVGFGTMNGKDGKPFKTRSGETIKLEDIIQLLVDKASEKLESNGVKYDRALALKIGIGAMKFGDLSNNVTKDYVFELDKFLAFEGKTGPYIQYTVARINSILKKLNAFDEKVKSDEKFVAYGKDEHDIIMATLKLLSAYESCYKERSLNMLCSASYDLASAFSTFYNNHHIISEQDKAKQKSYIALLKLVKKELSQSLGTLAIELPEKM